MPPDLWAFHPTYSRDPFSLEHSLPAHSLLNKYFQTVLGNLGLLGCLLLPPAPSPFRSRGASQPRPQPSCGGPSRCGQGLGGRSLVGGMRSLHPVLHLRGPQGDGDLLLRAAGRQCPLLAALLGNGRDPFRGSLGIGIDLGSPDSTQQGTLSRRWPVRPNWLMKRLCKCIPLHTYLAGFLVQMHTFR